jgi:hypothetical protein
MVVLGALAWWAVRSRIEALGKAGGAAGGGA